MSSKALCNIMRIAVVAAFICVISICAYMPVYGSEITQPYPEFARFYLPWLIFLWTAALPCFTILILIWFVSSFVKTETIFTLQTARLVKTGAMLLFYDAGFFFAGNVVFALLGMRRPGFLILSLFIDVFGVSLAVMAAVLSRYLTKAAALQEEVDSTI